MELEACLRDKIVSNCCEAIEANKHLLTKLDQAIGDGDHGVNMSRGFEAVKRAYQANKGENYSKLCQALGAAMVMNIGGASGPLFGSMVMGFGQASEHLPQTREAVHRVFRAGVEAVKQRGKADVGAKTMLDVLVPVCEALNLDAVSVSQIRIFAQQALGNTKDMIATKGRSAFLRERSQGHIDPGAQSSFLLINAVCDAVELCNG